MLKLDLRKAMSEQIQLPEDPPPIRSRRIVSRSQPRPGRKKSCLSRGLNQRWEALSDVDGWPLQEPQRELVVEAVEDLKDGPTASVLAV